MKQKSDGNATLQAAFKIKKVRNNQNYLNFQVFYFLGINASAILNTLRYILRRISSFLKRKEKKLKFRNRV